MESRFYWIKAVIYLNLSRVNWIKVLEPGSEPLTLFVSNLKFYLICVCSTCDSGKQNLAVVEHFKFKTMSCLQKYKVIKIDHIFNKLGWL